MVDMKRAALALGCCCLWSCTTLGPVPATTAVPAIPAGAPGIEAQVGLVPGFYLSRSAQNQSGGAIMPQLSALFDPDRLLGLPGLIIGARLYGQDKDTPSEPMIGYRHAFDDSLSGSIIGFGTSASATRHLASYSATHVGAEAAIDAKLGELAWWFQLHWQLAASATHVSASGTYCANDMDVAVDCDLDKPATNHVIDRKLSGTYGAATSTIALDLFRSPSIFAGARLGWMLAAGTMPVVQPTGNSATSLYWSTGLTVSFGLGAGAVEHTVAR